MIIQIDVTGYFFSRIENCHEMIYEMGGAFLMKKEYSC